MKPWVWPGRWKEGQVTPAQLARAATVSAELVTIAEAAMGRIAQLPDEDIDAGLEECAGD